jgi:hypothetical protein
MEETFIRRLHANGAAVERSIDADPAIILGVDPHSVPALTRAA